MDRYTAAALAGGDPCFVAFSFPMLGPVQGPTAPLAGAFSSRFHLEELLSFFLPSYGLNISGD